MNNCETFKVRLMGLLDGELPPAEAREVNEHLIRCPGCREEYEELREISGKIARISFVEPQDAVIEKLWKSPYSRFSRNAALGLVIGGYLLLVLYSLYEFLHSKNPAAVPKLAVAAIGIGFILLLIAALRERLKTYKSDPYKGIKR
jgi:anti-sigma factor RsiW